MCEYTSTTIITEDVNTEKYVYDESNGLWYELQGDYYIPCLTIPTEEERPIGMWGQCHLRYIKTERKALFAELRISGRLNTYLADINGTGLCGHEAVQHASYPGVSAGFGNEPCWLPCACHGRSRPVLIKDEQGP